MSEFAARVPTPLGDIVIVWTAESFPKVTGIYLPNSDHTCMELPDTVRFTKKGLPPLAAKIKAYFAGERVNFSMADLDLSVLGPFQKTILTKATKIPLGQVWSYGRLAAEAGCPRAARAVGNEMARNPYPLVVPCHRVVRANGELGGFGSGPELKRELLLLEGVKFATKYRVATTE